MKKIFLLFFTLTMIFSACGPKPYYKTNRGKKKTKHYNDILYDQKWKSNKRY